MNIKQKFNEYIASGDPIISISDEQRDWILPFIERCVEEERKQIGLNIAMQLRAGMQAKEVLDVVAVALTQEDKIK